MGLSMYFWHGEVLFLFFLSLAGKLQLVHYIQ